MFQNLRLPWQILLVAVAYFVLGKIGLMLAIPPGYATPMWPPSGLALAALLLWGYRCWPGILLGSLLVNISVGLNTDGTGQLLSSIAIAFLIACGASAQAVGSCYLVQRFTRGPWRFDVPAQIFSINLLGGVIGCTINATLGNLVLLAFGLQSPQSLPYAWFNWWVGDTIGVFFFASLILMLASSRNDVRAWRKSWVATPMLLMFLLVMGLFATAQHYERVRILERLHSESSDIMHDLRSQIGVALEVLSSLNRFFQSSDFVARSEFHSYTAGILATTPGIAALGWIPEVREPQRAEYEQLARADGLTGFTLTDREENGELHTAASRPLYFPLFYIEPQPAAHPLLGLDLANDPAHKQAIDAALYTGQFAATDLNPILQDAPHHPAVLIFDPVTSPAHSDGHNLLVEIIRFSALVDTVMPLARRKAISFTIMDQHMEHAVINQTGDLIDKRMPLDLTSTRIVHDLKIADQVWKVVFPLTKHYIDQNSTWYVWMVLAGGMVISSLLGNLLMIITGHQAGTERMVELRTLELQQQKNELERTRNELVQANEHKNIFLANMSHELRTPLNSIIGFSRRLLKSAPDRLNEREVDGLNATLMNGKMLLELINDLLDLSKIEAGKMDVNPEHVNVNQLLAMICKTLTDDCAEKGLVLNTRLPPQDITLFTDPVRLTQIMTNLIGNAIKYTERGSVTVELLRISDHARQFCRINVIDTGNGIPDDIRNSLFVAFTRAREVQLKIIQGSGLGLSIAAHLTSLLGGTIGVDSVPGKGSTFHVQFPLERNPFQHYPLEKS